MDSSTLSKHPRGSSFHAVCVFLKSYRKTAGEILHKNIDKHDIQSQSQIFVLVYPEQGTGKTSFKVKPLFMKTLGLSPHIKKTVHLKIHTPVCLKTPAFCHTLWYQLV